MNVTLGTTATTAKASPVKHLLSAGYKVKSLAADGKQ